MSLLIFILIPLILIVVLPCMIAVFAFFEKKSIVKLAQRAVPSWGKTHIPKPWGYEVIWAQTPKYVGKILHLNQGAKLSVQYHHRKDETFYVTQGKVALRYGVHVERLNRIELVQGEGYHVWPGVIHCLEAVDGEAELLEVSTPELQDVVRLSDKYGRNV